jgi:hypothetical protein
MITILYPEKIAGEVHYGKPAYSPLDTYGGRDTIFKCP